MSVEHKYFKANFYYRVKFVNKCIIITRFSKNEKRKQAYKNFLFKMMKDIVRKNIFNYINLLSGTHRKDSLPDSDELLSECYIIFDKCISKYNINKRNNFYFYFNKSLSRSFFRYYQKELKRGSDVEITENITNKNNSFHCNDTPDTIEILMDQIQFDEIKKRICRSRMLGEKTSEFLEKNKDISVSQYSKSLKIIKEMLLTLKEKGEI